MASIETRTHKTGTSYRVIWRQGGRKQQETFPDATHAAQFRLRVEAEGNRWPRGWIPGRGFPEDQTTDTPGAAPKFRHYAEKTITARARADEGTKATYRRMLANHITPVIGERPVDTITRFDVSDVAQRMAAAGLSQKTVSNVHALLSSILTDAVTDRILDRNPAIGAMPDMPTTKTEEMCFLSKGEFAMIVRQIRRPEDQALARLLAGTGLRWSEATALQVGDIDLLGGKQLHVRRAWKRRGAIFELGSPKTVRSRRSVDLSSQLVELLIPLVSAREPAEFVFTAAGGGEIRHANWYHRVWIPALLAARHCDTHRPDAIKAQAARRNARRRATRIGDPLPAGEVVQLGCSCPGTLTKTPRIHDLRHTHASWLLADKITLPAIQRRLGHESITTTIDRYSHLAPEHADEINAAVDRALTEV